MGEPKLGLGVLAEAAPAKGKALPRLDETLAFRAARASPDLPK